MEGERPLAVFAEIPWQTSTICCKVLVNKKNTAAMASPADVEKGMKMAEQEMEYRVDLFNKYARKDSCDCQKRATRSISKLA